MMNKLSSVLLAVAAAAVVANAVAAAVLRVEAVRAVGLLSKRKYYTCFHRKEFRRISGELSG